MRIAALLVGVAMVLVGAPMATASGVDAYTAVDARITAAKAAMIGDSTRALALADSALATARALPASRRAALAEATAEWVDGEANIFSNHSARAAPLIEAALATANRIAPNSRLQGDLLRSRGAIAERDGRIQDALVAFQAAYRVFTVAHETRQQSLALEDIGQVYDNAGDYPRALRFYAQSTDIFSKEPPLLMIGHFNRAEVLRKLHRDAAAIEQYQVALRAARVMHSDVLQARVLANIAWIEADRGHLATAEAAENRAFRLTASGEAAGWRPFVLGTQAYVALASGEVARAASLFDTMFAGVDLTRTDMRYREFHQIAARVYEARDRDDLALAHFKAFHRLDDGARDVTASVGSQLMSARFDFANQNLRISTLQRGELERDFKLVQQRNLLQTMALGAGGVLLALLLFGTVSLRRSRDKVRAGNVQLTHVNERLEKALAAKTEFLATTSHEIRTPLNGILGMAQVLLARDSLDQDSREKMELLQSAGKTMQALVDDILDVAKMEKGDVAVLREPIPLRTILENAVRLWRGHAEAKGLELRLDLDVPATVLSDEARLRQIVSNLLSNAVKFTEHGSVSLSASVETGADEIGMLSIAVADTGIGIAVDQQALVFDAFHQVDGATTRQFSGTGLGLAICRRLAEAFGGSLTVASEPGGGSTFCLRIPLLTAASADVATGVSARPTALKSARVLVVGNNFMTRGAILSLLERHTGGVEAMHGCDQARAALADGRVHHVLIDASAQLQQAEGLHGMRALIARAGELGLWSTVLISTDGAIPVAELLTAGASQSIVKPVTSEALVAAMQGLYPVPVDHAPRLDQAA